MRFNLYLNQVKVLEWGLNLAQAAVFSVLNEASNWANSTVFDGNVYYWFSKTKLIEELPMVTDKPDTAVRHMAALEKAGLILRKVIVENNKTFVYVAITEKGKQWNAASHPCEPVESEGRKNIRPSEKKSASPRKNIRPPSDKFPTNNITNNPITNDPDIDLSDSGESNEQVNQSIDLCSPPANVRMTNQNYLKSRFDEFYEVYGKKANRSGAEKAFSKIKLPAENRELFVSAIIDCARCWGELFRIAPSDQKAYQPHPASWINGKRWEDEALPTLRQAFPVGNEPVMGTSRDQVNDCLTNIQDTNW
ncbi:hypothetical protein [Marinomonas sp. S3726]|uniref:hypothetical protein n=1 Tax=Marinomonas sp. S3726 TaxID=579484 RepID=UPI00069915AF|nr:hypothetical protein [Marinomonas sp. S3726]